MREDTGDSLVRSRPSAAAASLQLGVVLLLGCSTTPHVTNGAAGHAGADAGAADSSTGGHVGGGADAAYSGTAGRGGTAADSGTAGRAGRDANAADSSTVNDPCATNNGGCGDSTFWTCKSNTGAAPTCTSRCSAPNACTANYVCKELTPGETCRGQFADWPPAYSASAFTVNGNGTVTDSRSGLVWQQAIDGETYFFPEAKTVCAGLSLDGTGWRVPTKAELESIVDRGRYNPAIDPTAFPGTPSASFWSSSPHPALPGAAYYVSFTGGNTDRADTFVEGHVRCVR